MNPRSKTQHRWTAAVLSMILLLSLLSPVALNQATAASGTSSSGEQIERSVEKGKKTTIIVSGDKQDIPVRLQNASNNPTLGGRKESWVSSDEAGAITTLSIQKNTSGKSRKSDCVFVNSKGETWTLCILQSKDTSNRYMSFSGGTISVDLCKGLSYDSNIILDTSTKNSWIPKTSTSDGILTIYVNANESSQARCGRVVVNVSGTPSMTIYINQDGKARENSSPTPTRTPSATPTPTVTEPDEPALVVPIIIGAAGGTKDIDTGIAAGNIAINAEGRWFNVGIIGSIVRLVFPANTSVMPKHLLMYVVDKSTQEKIYYHITQLGAVPSITPTPTTPAPTEIVFPASGGWKDLNPGIAEANIAIHAPDRWFNIGIVDSKVRIIVPENLSTSRKDLTMYVADKGSDRKVYYRIIQLAATATPTPTPKPATPTPTVKVDSVMYVKVTFHAEGDVTTDTVTTQIYGTKYKLPKNPTKSGYTFAGWYTYAVGGQLVDSTTPVKFVADHTLYAHWVKNTSTRICCDPVYSKDSNLKQYISVIEGTQYGNIPTPYPRTGFEFDGWYTEPYGGKPIKSSDTYTDSTKTTIYAHWTVNIHFIDYLYYDMEAPVVEAQEGCQYVIPEGILYQLEKDGEKVIGWSTFPGAGAPDSGSTRNTYKVPSGLTESNLNLYAIRQSGASLIDKIAKLPEVTLTYCEELLVKELLKAYLNKWQVFIDLVTLSPEPVKNAVESLLQSSFDSRVHFAENCSAWGALQSKVGNRPLNGQAVDPTLSGMKIGSSTIGEAGCGIIACYNALLKHNYRIELPTLIAHSEDEGYLLHNPLKEVIKGVKALLLLSTKIFGDQAWIRICYYKLDEIQSGAAIAQKSNPGELGLNPYKIDDILNHYGIATKSYQSATEIIDFYHDLFDAYQNKKVKNYIVTYWCLDNVTDEIESAHTVYITTNTYGATCPCDVVIYNRYSNSIDVKDMYISYRELIEKELYVNNGNKVIVAYEIP